MSFVRTVGMLLSASFVFAAASASQADESGATPVAQPGAATSDSTPPTPSREEELVLEAKRLTDGLDAMSKDREVLRSNIPKLQRLIEISQLINQQDGAGRPKWMFILAYTHDQLNDVPEAMRLYREYLAATERTSPEPEGEKSAVLLRLARAEANQGDLAQARGHAAQVAEYFVADPASAKKEILARKYLIYIECASAAWPSALDQLERYVELTRAIRRERLDDEIVFRARHAYLCGVDPSLRDRCREILDEACRTAAETFGPDSAEAGSAQQWLAMFQYRAADPTCVDTMTKADRILLVARDETEAGTGYRRLRLAKYCRAFGRLDQARGIYESELQQLRAAAAPDANRLAIALGFLAGIDAHQGRRPEAEQGYREAVRLASTRHDEIAKDLAPFFSKQRDELAAGRLPALSPADNVDTIASPAAIP